MTSHDLTSPSKDATSATIARAAALLEAVARDSEQAGAFEVPLLCGHAADRLHAVPGWAPIALPTVGDDAAAINAAMREAFILLCTLPVESLSGPVLDAVFDAARAVLAAGEALHDIVFK